MLGLIYTIAIALYLQFSLVEVCFLQRVYCIGNGNKIAEPSNIQIKAYNYKVRIMDPRTQFDNKYIVKNAILKHSIHEVHPPLAQILHCRKWVNCCAFWYFCLNTATTMMKMATIRTMTPANIGIRTTRRFSGSLMRIVPTACSWLPRWTVTVSGLSISRFVGLAIWHCIVCLHVVSAWVINI